MTFAEQLALRCLLIWIQIVLWACAASGADHAEIQSLLNKGGAVRFPPGVHVVGPLSVPGNVTSMQGSRGDPTIFKAKPMMGQSARLMHIKHSGDTDRVIFISRLSFDMNAGEQGVISNDTTGSQGAIFLEADKAKAGRLVATVSNVDGFNSAGDIAYVYHGVDLDLSNFRTTDVFRSGLGVTGKNATVRAERCVMIRSGIDVEPNSPGDVVNVTLRDIECSKFDIALRVPGCSAVCERINANGFLYLYCHPQSNFVCRDSKLFGRYSIRLPGQSVFERCALGGLPGNPSPVVAIQWAHNSIKTDMRLTLRDCTISGPGSIGIDAGIDATANRNWLVLQNVAINGTKAGAAAQKTSSGREQRGNWLLENATFEGVPIR